MLPTFLDDADKLLVRLAFQYAQQNRRVEWSTVARKLRRFRINKTTKELETRLRTLKRAHGNDLSKFPPCFFSSTRRADSSSNTTPSRPRPLVLDYQAAACLLRSVFRSVTKTDVQQKAGVLHENAGELLPQAVAVVINIIGTVRADDVFLDIGCGIGNIVAQFALQTAAQRCLGIEIRPQLCHLSCQLINRYALVQPLLKKVVLLEGNAKDCGISAHALLCQAPIVYLNSFLFVDDVKMLVLQELCALPRAGFVISTESYCLRHRPPSALSGNCNTLYGDQPVGRTN
ncbi:hypothetical protein PF005_g30344 [Phytophthora fragariae]|uniref:Histone-lysine N-methyltransferase, H3 lysine-79 specific n=1 Tax=Phytophthora fragariae TaxID=53985 RepID=A0A6A3QZ80_9STRA|nr:hypothetical protein PF011_g27821 [Phytophthora fragariae]KAE9084348.1 hypothetical protein PF006_g26492 [Phytophthora fragariae]KAE9163682.1 hypothetical protein PF005_g30344 [Phytophthora fragariae]